jgi:hypothetical protein
MGLVLSNDRTYAQLQLEDQMKSIKHKLNPIPLIRGRLFNLVRPFLKEIKGEDVFSLLAAYEVENLDFKLINSDNNKGK